MMKRVEVDVNLTPEQVTDRNKRIETMLKNKGVQAFLSTHHLDESMVHKHVQKFETWRDNLKKCKDCPGLHACKQDTSGYVLELNYEDMLSWELKPCGYKQLELEKTAHQMFFVHLDASRHFLEAEVSRLLDDDSDDNYM
jgi:hypothetical protein